MRGDILVIGGGPAGCTAARLLALWGHQVLQCVLPERRAAILAESLPPSTDKLFDAIGLRAVIDAAGFVRSTGNTVWWGDEERLETFARGALGWQITRAELAAVLLRSASEAGVNVQQRRVTDMDDATRQHRIVIDCSGRAGLIARARGWRIAATPRRTIAIAASWGTAGEWAIPDQTQTLVESYQDGWCWSVPTRDGRRHFAVMVDPRTSELPDGESSREVYLHEIGKTSRIAALTAHATLDEGPWGWDASTYHAARYAEDNVLVAGDAASFVDPLSSAGVQKALASGWLAAIAANTALARPAMREIAWQCFEAREREMYASIADATRRHFAVAAAAHRRPFWDVWAETQDASTRLTGPASAIARQPEVQAGYDRIRASAAIRLALAGHARIDRCPAIGAREIVLESRIVTRAFPAGVRYVCDVDLLALLDAARGLDDPGFMFEAYCRRAAPVPLPAFLTALAAAAAHQLIEVDYTAGENPPGI